MARAAEAASAEGAAAAEAIMAAAARITLVLCFLLAQLAGVVLSQAKDSSGWSCENDGYWYQNGVKTQHSCGKDAKKEDKNSCTRSENPDMPKAYPKTCINGPPDNGLRCWWTYVPAAVKASAGKVPLVIDMHGGGGCASHAAQLGGFKELSDTLGKDSFIVVWPQGYNLMWGTCGSDCAQIQKDENAAGNKKQIQSTDDLTFLSKMIGHIVMSQAANPAKGLVDAERLYVTGFSMGCMMSHRMALEKSNIIAGFGCHGGTLIALDSDIADMRGGKKPKRFNLLPMPAYMTGGTNDGWFRMAGNDAWAAWNGCSNVTTTSTTMENIAKEQKNSAKSPNTAHITVHSSCNASSVPPIEVVTLNITNGSHVRDPRMAQYTWNFLRKYRRLGVLAELPDVDSGAIVDCGNCGRTSGASLDSVMPLSLALMVALSL